MNTEHHNHQWTKESRLRDRKVAFVSAGTIEPVKEAQLDEANVKAPTEDDQIDSDLDGSEGAMARMDIHSSAEQTLSEAESLSKEVDMDVDTFTAEEPPAFFVDTEGDASLAVKGPPPTFRSSSPARSDSSGEVLFRGRRGPVTVRDDPPQHQSQRQRQSPVKQRPLSALASAFSPAPAAASAAAAPSSALGPAVTTPPLSAAPVDDPHVTDTLMRLLDGQDDEPSAEAPLNWLNSIPPSKEEPKHWQHANGLVSDRQEVWPAVQPTPRLDEDLSGVKSSSRKSKKGRKKQNKIFRLQSDLQDELLQDYIDNMDDEERAGILASAGPRRDSIDDVFNQLLDQEEANVEVDANDLTGANGSTQNGSDDDDDDDAWEDEDEDDDEVEDEEEDDDEDMDSSELEEHLEYTEREQWEDEEDLRQRHMDAMTDEEIARIFAKQQELGIDGDDIVLFDEGFGDLGAARAGLEHISGTAGFGSRSRNKNGMRRPKRGRKSDQFPDASLMADVLEQDPYGGFDVMDFDRPSLKAKPKGRKSAGALPEELLELSDEDLRDTLQSQWTNDRNKKASRKAEREELRQLGLLGKKNKFKPDLKARYQEGITMAQIREEFRDFLEDSDTDTRAFPPMLKDDRKILHEMATHFNLKSKSVGSGKNRAPVLVKNRRTLDWDEARFSRAQGFITRGYLKNPGGKKAGGSKAAGFAQARKGRMAGGGGAASYANGDVVGAAAPEIGATNFGRKLMEKMGWSAGMALGKEGNSGGLLVPVQATIKSGKAGLG